MQIAFATGKDESVFAIADSVVADIEALGLEVLYDDRPKVSPGVKFSDAEIIGVPVILIVGKGAADGIVEVWNRRTGDRSELPITQALALISSR